MATAKRKTKLSLPPASEVSSDHDEKAMKAMIEKGGSVKAEIKKVKEQDQLKSFTFKIYESELEKIREILERMPSRDRISMTEFITNAVKNKIKKMY